MRKHREAEELLAEAEVAVAAWRSGNQSDADNASDLAEYVEALSSELRNALKREAALERERPINAEEGMLRFGDANAVAELLREQLFIGDGLGCYYNFDVLTDAREWSEEERKQFFCEIGYIDPADRDEWNDWQEVAARSHGYSFNLDPYQIEAAWYWDGDGTLCFRVWHNGELLRSLINYDCKKPYRWEESERLHFDKQLAPAASV